MKGETLKKQYKNYNIMTLYFITGNKFKFEEVKRRIPEIKQLQMDLPEIQSLDTHEICREKLLEARKHHEGSFIVEDVSFEIDCLQGLPGPLIKWVENTIKATGIAELVHKYENHKATAISVMGYCDEEGNITFFDGIVKGTIVKSNEGNVGFGFDPIFLPDGHDKTFYEMGEEQKSKISHRGLAVRQLQEFLKE